MNTVAMFSTVALGAVELSALGATARVAQIAASAARKPASLKAPFDGGHAVAYRQQPDVFPETLCA
jgi:hypothetical protein